MGKPSIFSKEYEKKMKKRKRTILIFSLAVIVVIAALVFKVIYNPIDYKNIKNNIQAWIDSDTTNVDKKTQTETKANNNEDTNKKEEPAKKETPKPAEEFINITLASGNTAKAIYVDNNGEKIFKTVESSDTGISFDLSPSGKQIIVMDTNAVITLYNVDGTNKVVSKDQYVSTKGSVFAKDSIIQSNPGYLWNVNPKFISEDKIIFVTNRPYFGGAALKQYIWMTDISNDSDKIFWDLAGQSIEIGAKEEKGVKVTVDGQTHYIDMNGNNIQ